MSSIATTYRILVVEDNEDVRKVVTVYLRSKGFVILEAVDGQSALEMARSEKPDLILFDVLLPKIDGIEALKQLRKTPEGARVPVVMMSAILQNRDVQSETASLNVSAFLQKPFQVRMLLEKINEALGSRASADSQSSAMIRPGGSAARQTQSSMGGISEEANRSAAGKATMTNLRRHEIPDGRTQPSGTHAAGASARDASAQNERTRRMVYRNPKLPDRGTLAQLPMPGIIHAAFAGNITGRLRIVSATTEKRIYFQNGFPVYSESSLPEETLGAYLVAQGRMTLEQHVQVQREMTMSGRQYGEVLLKLNFLGPHELYGELERHLAEKVVSTFTWTEGQFLFEPGEDWKDAVVIARMKPGRIILDGIGRFWSDEYVAGLSILAMSHRPFVLEDSLYQDDHLGLSTQEARIVQLFKRDATIAQIISSAGDSSKVLKLLIAFYIMGKVGFSADLEETVIRSSNVPSPLHPRTSIPPEIDPRAQVLLSEYLKYRTCDYFKLLGVPRGATSDEIEQAFQVRQKRYHPDALVGIDAGLIHEKMEELYMRLHKARQTLLDPGERARYIASLDHGARSTMLTARSRTGRVGAITIPDKHATDFEDGFTFLRNGNAAAALELFQKAEKESPKAKYQAFRIWAEYLVNPRRAQETEEGLRGLFEKNKDEALLPFLLGNFFLKEKKSREAISWFEKALQIDPQHIDSTRQLRLLRMRQNEEPSSLFNLKDLFKKDR